MTQLHARDEAILEELDTALQEYLVAKDSHDRALVQFDAARNRFARVKELAQNGLDFSLWITWINERPYVRFAGDQIGDAIQQVLRVQAYGAAKKFVDGESKTYEAGLYLHAITKQLDEGGFEFQSASPRREVNAALMNLSGITKGKPGTYFIEDNQEILQMFQPAAITGTRKHKLRRRTEKL